ncbi:MAG: hypothetical protein VX498_12280, partial [Myxococcota bacterium]|nr:hypothetical protein [Myxococcota bacterium]
MTTSDLKRKSTCTGFGLLALALALGACTPVDGGPGSWGSTSDHNSYPPGPLHPDTLLVEELDAVESADVAEDLSTIQFSFLGGAEDIGLEPGRIVAGTSDGGYLRRIETVDLAGNEAFVTTSPATLEEAVTDVSIHEEWEWGARQVTDFSGRSLGET